LRYCVESASAYAKRQDLRVLSRIRTEPATAFIASVLLGSAISVALYGSGKTNAKNASAAYQSHSVPAAASSTEFSHSLAPNTLPVITSHDVDLRRDSRVTMDSTQPVGAKPTRNKLISVAAASAVLPTQVAAPAKRKQNPIHISKWKAQTEETIPGRPEAITNSTQPPTSRLVETSQPVAPETAKDLSLSNAVFPDLSRVPVMSASTPSSLGKPSSAFIDVGTFKDETWANSAAEKLTALGFHAVVFHKALLWAQSYHVEVGPYNDPKEIETARRDLVLNGYKPHLVN